MFFTVVHSPSGKMLGQFDFPADPPHMQDIILVDRDTYLVIQRTFVFKTESDLLHVGQKKFTSYVQLTVVDAKIVSKEGN